MVSLAALLESVVFSVHLQNVYSVPKAVQQRSGQAFRTKALIEGQVGCDQSRAPLIALTEDLKQKLRPGFGQGNEAQFIGDQQLQAG